MWFKKKKAEGEANDQCVIVYLPLSDSNFGAADERDRVHRVTDKMDAAIRANKAGEFDGDEFGGGECRLYMYGPSADRLFEVILPIVQDWEMLKGGYIIKRYGPPGSRSERVEFP